MEQLTMEEKRENYNRRRNTAKLIGKCLLDYPEFKELNDKVLNEHPYDTIEEYNDIINNLHNTKHNFFDNL